MGSQRDCTWILGLPGFRVVRVEREDDGVESRLRLQLERRGIRRYVCNGCGRRTGRVRAARERTWDDLPWALHPVTLVYRQRRVICRHCGVRTERIEFATPKARVTRRLRQQIGLDCQSMPTSHAAVRHRVSWGKARRAETAFLTEWDRTRRQRRPRYIGLDEVQRGKGQRFWTVPVGCGARRGHGRASGSHNDYRHDLAHGGSRPASAGRDPRGVYRHAPALSQCGHAGAAAGRRGVRQIPCPPACERRARRGPPPRVLPRRGRDACPRARETLVAAPALEDGPRLEAPGNCRRCLPRIAGCSKPISCANSSTASGRIRRRWAWGTSSSAG